MANELFNGESDQTTEIDPNKDYLSELVGEGKKYRDERALARSRVEADAHIRRLESELRELREQNASKAKLEDLVNQIQTAQLARQSNPSNSDNQAGEQIDPQNENKSVLTEEAIEQLLDKTLTKREQERKKQENFEYVVNVLQETLGPNFKADLTRKRAELGLGEQFLNDLAQTQPKAFLKLLDINPEVKQNNSLFAPPATRLNTGANTGSSNKKGWTYFQKMRRENPKVYEATGTIEMLKAIKEMGEEAFYAS